MKRFFVLLSVIALFISVACPCFANEKSFDSTVFENEDGYDYDKFDKTWSYIKLYVRTNDPNSVPVIGICIFGDSNGLTTPVSIRVRMNEWRNEELINTHIVTDIYFLIGEYVYHCANVDKNDMGDFYLTDSCSELLEALALANTVTVRLAWNGGKEDFEIPTKDYITTIKIASQLVLENSLFDYYDEEWETSNKLSQYTIEKY